MLNRLLDLLVSKPEPPETPDPDRVRVATCVILLEVAGADSEFSPEECERILELVRKRFDLSQEEAEELLDASQDRRRESLDLWKFTSQINQAYSQAEKVQIIEEVWRVIYADGRLDGHEDYLVHKLARLLNLTHPQLIDAKLAVIKDLRGGSEAHSPSS